MASNSHGPLAVGLSAHMQYFKPSRVGETVEAIAREVNLTRRTGVYQIEVRSGGELIATFTGTVYRKG
jgi:acyl-CoA thioesterase